MIDIKVQIEDTKVLGMFAKGPRVMEKHVGRALGRASQEVAREMRSAAPKAFSTLAQSIRALVISPFERHVGPGVDYAAHVETGTGPGGSPGVQTLLDWIKVKRIQPISPGIKSQEDLAHVLARMIPLKGTRAQPFVAPTAQKMQSRVFHIIQQGVEDGLREASA